MIYVDTSVALATLFVEERRVRPAFWDGPLVASRLLEYELWTRVNARGGADHAEKAAALLDRVNLVDLSPIVLDRALHPMPVEVRTLDALHLATALHFHTRRVPLEVATYDRRMAEAAVALGLPLATLG